LSGIRKGKNMFTGIIETVGSVKKIVSKGGYKILTVTPNSPFENLVLGESISVDGCCLTVIESGKDDFAVEASQETTRLTIIDNYKTGIRVNLERALQPSGRMGGHFVTGHIDCKGKIADTKKTGNSIEMSIQFRDEFDNYLIEKGSITVNGVSLTVNRITGNTFDVNLIPFTQKETTVNRFKNDDVVNLEFDILGKYVAKMINKNNKGRITLNKLIESGW